MMNNGGQIQLVGVDLDGTPMNDVGALSEVAAAACAKTATHYQKAGFTPPWISYLATCNSQIIGICAFTSAPSAGRVEIAYNTFSPFEGQGVATAMAGELVDRARRADPGVEVFAYTLGTTNASNAILRKLGFELACASEDAEEGMLWEWKLPPGSVRPGRRR